MRWNCGGSGGWVYKGEIKISAVSLDDLTMMYLNGNRKIINKRFKEI